MKKKRVLAVVLVVVMLLGLFNTTGFAADETEGLNDGITDDGITDDGITDDGITDGNGVTGDNAEGDSGILMSMSGSQYDTSSNSSSGYNLTVATIGEGTVSGVNNPYNYGQIATLTPHPAPGWRFFRWDGDGTDSLFSNNRTVLMLGHRNVTATFKKEYTLSVSAGTGGSLWFPGLVNGTYIDVDNVNLGRAVPWADSNYKFAGWQDDDYPTAPLLDKGTSVKMNMNRSYTAIFLGDYKDLKVTSGAHGKINDKINGKYRFGSQVNLDTAEPEAKTPGYEFKHWEKRIKKLFGPDTWEKTDSLIIVGDFNEFNAVFGLKDYTVTFDTDGGSRVESQTVTHGLTAKKPSSDPTKANHQFEGWYEDQGFTKEFDFNKQITSDTTVYAKWQIDRYEVRFISKSSTFATRIIDHGSTASAPDPAPMDEDEDFIGWFTESDTAFDFGTEITGPLTLYAKWAAKPTYTVTYDPNTAVTTGSAPIDGKAYKNGAVVDVMGQGTLEKLGYSFIGWSQSADGSPVGATFVMGNANVILYAQWAPITYKVAYDGNGATGGSMINSTHIYDDQASYLSPNGFERTGYTFIGWATSKYGSVKYGDRAKAENLASNQDEVVRLYAKWRANTYTVTYNENGGEGTMNKTTHTYNSLQLLAGNRFTKPGYTFIGWAKTADGPVAYVNRAPVFNLASEQDDNVNLYAKWMPNPYMVVYLSNGGSGFTMPSLHTYDSANTEYLTPNGYEKTGHEFAGWSRSKNGTPVYEDGQEVHNLTTGYTYVLYAQWTINDYNVTFESTGGSYVPDQTVTYNEPIDMPMNPIKPGYNFAGWFTSSELTTAWDFDNDKMPAGNIILYAKWDAKNYTVTYNSNGGTGGTTAVSTHVYDILSELTPNGFTREGYTFVGWNEAADGSGQYYFDKEQVAKLADGGTIELFAQWTLNEYTVTFIDYDGRVISTSPVNHGSGVTAPPNPTRVGYTFTGWSTNFDAVTHTMTVTAQYSINQYTVAFVDHNGVVLGVSTVNYGSAAAPPANPARTGYTFAGWNTAYNSVTGHMTVTAMYTINTYTVTFVNSNGTVLGTSTVEYGSAASAPTNPRRAGYRFTGWSAPFGTITGDVTVTAQYTAVRTLTVSIAGQGTVGLGSRTYDDGQIISLAGITATPEDGFEFVGWQDANGNPISVVTMNADTEIVAVFREIEVIAPEAVPEAVGGGTDAGDKADEKAAVDTIAKELVPEASDSAAWLWWLLLLIPAGLLLWWLVAARRRKEEEK